jgi:hypothetical protein
MMVPWIRGVLAEHEKRGSAPPVVSPAPAVEKGQPVGARGR